jgi:uncharacterized coiled-coil protein SlyX
MTTVNILRTQSGMNDDDMDTGFVSPFDRLDSLECYALENNMTLMQMNERIMEHSQLGVKISSHMIEMVRYIDILNSKIFELEHRLKEVESASTK